MPIIRELAASESGDLASQGSVEERGWLVECVAGADPRDEVGIPRLGDYLAGHPDQNGLELVCRSVRKGRWVSRYENASDVLSDLYEVAATYASPDLQVMTMPLREYPEWSMRFAREAIQVPFFYRVPRLYVPPGGTQRQTVYEWLPRPYSLELTFTVFEQVIYVRDDDLDLRDLMQIRAEVGKIHYFGNDYGLTPIDSNLSSQIRPDLQDGIDRRKLPWQFQAPTITMVRPHVFKIVYSWVNDPGNQAIDITAQPGTDPLPGTDFVIPRTIRKPFHRYDVRFITIGEYPSPIEVRPYIEVVPMYSEQSGWINPTGYQTLPGGPIS